MNKSQSIEELLYQWAVARAEGRELCVETLCRDSPELWDELRTRIEVLKGMAWMLETNELASNTSETIFPESNMTGDLLASELSAIALVGSAELDQVRSDLAQRGRLSAAELAGELMRRGKLTAYQARALAAGRGRDLALGNYLILDKIGEGGMGQVFKALHRRMKRVVAVKVLSPATVDSPLAIERFHREVEAVAKLDHPNIVTAHDADEAKGRHFLAMQYVEGSDLASYVRAAGPLPVGQAIDLILQAARGLAYAHGRGIVHRDIKPANLLIDRSGSLKILDLGLARLQSTEARGSLSDLTADGSVMGTADYMAPEQALDTHAADARADVYSLGCTLFYLLTGCAPYSGGSLMAKMLAHREQPIPDLQAVRPDAPPALACILEKMLAKQPSDRYMTMGELLSDLENCALQCPSTDRPYPVLEVAASIQIGGSDDTTTSLLDETIERPAIEKPAAAPPISVPRPPLRDWSRFRAIIIVIGLAVASGIALIAGVMGPGMFVQDLPSDDRATAQWALDLGSKIDIFVDEAYLELQPSDSLPGEGVVRVQAINFPAGTVMTQKHFARLAKVDSLKTLGCYGTELGDEAGPHLAKLATLEQLSLGNTRISDAVLEHVARLPKLKYLRLGETRIDDSGLEYLATMKSLEQIELWQTPVSPSGVARLQKALPDCEILSNSTGE